MLQPCATCEVYMVNTRQTVANRDGGKAQTTFESSLANTRQTVGEDDGGKTSTFRESTLIYACHAVAKSDGGKTRTICEFASRFISTTCVLNGRKMSTWIL